MGCSDGRFQIDKKTPWKPGFRLERQAYIYKKHAWDMHACIHTGIHTDIHTDRHTNIHAYMHSCMWLNVFDVIGTSTE